MKLFGEEHVANQLTVTVRQFHTQGMGCLPYGGPYGALRTVGLGAVDMVNHQLVFLAHGSPPAGSEHHTLTRRGELTNKRENPEEDLLCSSLLICHFTFNGVKDRHAQREELLILAIDCRNVMAILDLIDSPLKHRQCVVHQLFFGVYIAAGHQFFQLFSTCIGQIELKAHGGLYPFRGVFERKE
jgi:hypothetical protein